MKYGCELYKNGIIRSEKLAYLEKVYLYRKMIANTVNATLKQYYSLQIHLITKEYAKCS